MKHRLYTFLVAWFIVFVIGCIACYQLALWSKCRATNSIAYCMRVLSN